MPPAGRNLIISQRKLGKCVLMSLVPRRDMFPRQTGFTNSLLGTASSVLSFVIRCLCVNSLSTVSHVNMEGVLLMTPFSLLSPAFPTLYFLSEILFKQRNAKIFIKIYHETFQMIFLPKQLPNLPNSSIPPPPTKCIYSPFPECFLAIDKSEMQRK